MKYFIKSIFIFTIFVIVSTKQIYAQVTQEWVKRFSLQTDAGDTAYSIAVDGSGNVYVTGRSIDKNYDIATVKYNSSGTQQWVARYNGSGDDDDAAESMVIDGSANIYVTGYCTGSSTGKDYVIIKYNSSGTQQWVATYNGVGSGEDIAHTIKVDGSGNVYVTGRSKQYASTDFAYATVKYNSSGTQQWAAIYNGNGYDWDEAYSLAVDGSGNVFVTGKSEGPASFTSTYFDYATIKYNSSGSQQWEARYNGPGSDNDEAYALVIDGSSNVYITGRSKGNGTDFDYATIKYNSSGTQQWIARYDNDYNDEAYAITIDNSGNVYVTGGSYETGIEFDWATIKYSQNGDFIPQTPVTHKWNIYNRI